MASQRKTFRIGVAEEVRPIVRNRLTSAYRGVTFSGGVGPRGPIECALCHIACDQVGGGPICHAVCNQTVC